jgi:hypothetical protein
VSGVEHFTWDIHASRVGSADILSNWFFLLVSFAYEEIVLMEKDV